MQQVSVCLFVCVCVCASLCARRLSNVRALLSPSPKPTCPMNMRGSLLALMFLGADPTTSSNATATAAVIVVVAGATTTA